MCFFLQLVVLVGGALQIIHGILIQRLDFSVNRLEVQQFHFFWCFQDPFTIAAEIKTFKILGIFYLGEQYWEKSFGFSIPKYSFSKSRMKTPTI